MKIGVCLPYLKAGVTREDYLHWFQRIDQGPFHSLSCGERVNGPSYDMGSLLAAAAVATERVEINATLYVLPMHSAVRVAKEIATIDVLSGGRVKRVTLGYGGRPQDYEAMGAAYIGRYGRMDRQVEVLRRVWKQEQIVEGGEPIGPLPLHDGGPELLAGVFGPQALARCARWADGIYAWSGNGEAAELQTLFDRADAAWKEAGRDSRPYRLGGFWFTLADDGKQRMYDYVYNYLAIAGDEIATAMAGMVHRHNADAINAALDNAEEAGCEEVFLVPATADIAEVDRLSELLSRRQ
jgi:alkanesulfonate monooxygenase SsuD/methylene tetrahydromethanopterin reductase-like flavin-dependent oxidoreductase (luciferase family)